MSVSPSLVGILLVGETQTSRSQIIGATCLPPGARSQTLKQLRVTLSSTLPSEFREKTYLFLTPKGWKISGGLEESLTAADVIDQDMCVRIQVDYAKPRIGIVVEREHRDGTLRDVPLGFVLCELNKNLSDLARQIMQELMPSYPVRIPAPFSFLDRNDWPVASDQETHFTVVDVIGDNVVRIRFNRRPGDSPQLTAFSVSYLAPSQVTRPASPSATETEPARQLLALESKTMESAAWAPGHKTITGEILISYVRSEATPHAIALKQALQREGYSVFLDVDCIEGGADWQDALNEAISRCSLFVPLVTLRYGYTLWTNREVKLADILGKAILPVSFISNWPPPCLAIQFSTTQYIEWDQQHSDITDSSKATPGNVSTEASTVTARAIVQCYQKELRPSQDEVDGDVPDTPAIIATSQAVVAKPSVKSCPSLLPSSVPKDLQESLQRPRSGKPLVVVVCHPAQQEMAAAIAGALEGDGSEVWCSCDPTTTSEVTHVKINEAGVVIMMFSEEFVKCEKCQASVFYSEQRKRIVPLFVGSVLLPDWAAMLVGTNNFIDSRSSGFVGAILNRVRTALDPKAQECELAMAAKQKEELDKLCADLAGKLPKGPLVYISGGTRFFSPSGEAICVELGTQLAKERGITLVTGGFYGVGETVGRSFYNERTRMGESAGVYHVVATRDDQDKSPQTRQRPDGTFEAVPYGNTMFYGSSVRQREMLTPRLLDLCVLIEGGPGAAFEVQQFSWNEKYVIPVLVTGGAASGLFEVPQSVFQRPRGVSESDWSLLGSHDAKPCDIAAAIVRIVRALDLERKDKAAALVRADTEIVSDGDQLPRS